MNSANPSKQEDDKAVIQEIIIRVKHQDESTVYFKMKKNIRLKKLMQTYCARKGYPLNSVRFLYEGAEFRETDTPDSLKMENGDEIEANEKLEFSHEIKDFKEEGRILDIQLENLSKEIKELQREYQRMKIARRKLKVMADMLSNIQKFN